jgi:hypothetical protein
MGRTYKQDGSKAVRTSVTLEPDQLIALRQEAATATKREDQSVSGQLRLAVDLYRHRLTKRRSRTGADLNDD